MLSPISDGSNQLSSVLYQVQCVACVICFKYDCWAKLGALEYVAHSLLEIKYRKSSTELENMDWRWVS